MLLRAAAGALAATLAAPARAGEPGSEAAHTEGTAADFLARGQADAADGRVRAAVVSCRRALRLANEAGAEGVAGEAYRCLEAAEKRVVHLHIENAPPGTTLSIGGGDAGPAVEHLELDPGSVVVTATLPDGALEPEVLNLRDGEKRVLDLATLPRVPIIPAQPVRWGARPLTLPSGTVALGAWAFFPNATEQQPLSPERAADDTRRFSGAGYAVGVRGAASDDVELEVMETFTHGYLPGDVLLGLKVRLLSGDFELALGGTGRIPAFRAEVGGGYLSLSGLGRIGDVLRIDGSLGLAAVKGPERALGSKASVGLFQPADVALGEWLPTRPGLALSATVNPVAYLHLALETGFGIQDFTKPSSSFVPLAFRVGGAIPSDDAPIIDIDLHFVVPYFLMPVKGDERWPAHAERVVVSDSWWVTLGLWGYIYT